jgi:hypothetical protein
MAPIGHEVTAAGHNNNLDQENIRLLISPYISSPHKSFSTKDFEVEKK